MKNLNVEKSLKNEAFLGNWQVRELAFDASGNFLGVIEQERQLMLMPNTNIKVLQRCQPEDRLLSHGMGSFSGFFEFQLQKDGVRRNYLGPDVVGQGQSIGKDFLIGQGSWPRFGYNFCSWSVMIDSCRQITGGTFSRGSSILAVIVGTASPRDPKNISMEPIDANTNLEAITSFSGLGYTKNRDIQSDRIIEQKRSRQAVGQLSWVEIGPHEEKKYDLKPWDSGFQIFCNGAYVGMGEKYGASIQWELFTSDGHSVKGIDILDEKSNSFASLRQYFANHSLISLEAQLYRGDENQKKGV